MPFALALQRRDCLPTLTSRPLIQQQNAYAPASIAFSRRQTFIHLLPIVGFALLLRLLFVALNYASLPVSPHFDDFGAEMGWTARSLATGHGYSSPFLPVTGPTALVPPLYPLLLSGIFRTFGLYSPAAAFMALAVNSLFSSLTAAVIFLGLRHRFGLRMARLVAWTWALYPFAIYYSAVYLWDCALTSLLFSCCFFLAINRLPGMRPLGWAGYGLLSGIAVLSNPSVLIVAVLLVGIAASRRRSSGLQWMPRMVFALLALAVTLTPWMARNAITLHTSPTLRNGFWGEFYAGNNGDTSRTNPGWTHPASSPAEMTRFRQLGETGYMAEKEQLSLAYVRSHPGAFALVSTRRVIRYWTGYWSFSHEYLAEQAMDVPNVPLCCVLTALMLIGLWQLYRRSRRDALPYLTTLVVFPLPYYVTHASIDYREAIEPIIVVTVVCGAVSLIDRIRRHSQDEHLQALGGAT